MRLPSLLACCGATKVKLWRCRRRRKQKLTSPRSAAEGHEVAAGSAKEDDSNDDGSGTVVPDPEMRRSRRMTWSQSLVASDPRRQIFEFFRAGDQRGPLGLLRALGEEPEGEPVKFFSAWRPTSLDAVRMMMEGRATGKGLNVKGKSAKQGRISGFVPFVQIHEEAHKRRVPNPPADALARVFFASEEARDAAAAALEVNLREMVELAASSQAALDKEKESGVELDDALRERYLEQLSLRVTCQELELLDDTGCGISMPQRLLWQAFVVRQDISRSGEWETGRGSEPDYMDLNNKSVRTTDDPQVVIYQAHEESPLSPLGLLVAYEEEGRVLPVASDFDAFTIGSCGIVYPSMPVEQLPFVESLLRNIEKVLATPGPGSWSHRWLEVLKGEINRGQMPPTMISDTAASAQQDGASGSRTQVRRMTISGTFGRKDARQGEPRFGFGDALHYSIVEHATDALRLSGAVRHAAECYNFYVRARTVERGPGGGRKVAPALLGPLPPPRLSPCRLGGHARAVAPGSG